MKSSWNRLLPRAQIEKEIESRSTDAGFLGGLQATRLSRLVHQGIEEMGWFGMALLWGAEVSPKRYSGH
jgi:hypothetical protein